MARIRQRVVTTLVAVVAALAMASVAGATTYFQDYLTSSNSCDGDSWRACSGWNTTWYYTETQKPSGYTERVGFRNDRGSEGYTQGVASLVWTNVDIVGIYGYRHAFVRNVSGVSLYNTASVCVC